MSISDDLMCRYLSVLLRSSTEEISYFQERVAAGNLHPKALKKQMAHDIIALFWSAKEADFAQQQFEALFEQKDYTKAQEIALPQATDNPLWIVDLLKLLGAVKTSSEAKRLIEGGAVRVDGAPIKDFSYKLEWQSGMVIKVGKHRIYSIA